MLIYPIGTTFIVNNPDLIGVKMGDTCVVTGFTEDGYFHKVLFNDGQPGVLNEQAILNNYLVKKRQLIIIME